MSDQATNPTDIRLAAMDFLARREHSRRELKHKLKRRFDDEQLIDEQLDRLREENLQSDARFAESFARQRAGRGFGPLRVRQAMRDKGLSDSEIDQALAVNEFDWYALAEEVFRKKFGEPVQVDVKEKARRSRFMQYRGFGLDHYQYMLD